MIQLVPPAPAPPEINWAAVERNSCSVAELAPLLGITPRAVLDQIERGVYKTYKVPSRRAVGKFETRVQLHSIPVSIQKRLLRQRRREAKSEKDARSHPGGLVLRPNEDKRLALTPAEEQIVWGLWNERSKPPVSVVFDRLISCCIRCQGASLSPTFPGYRGRYNLHRCATCGFTLTYATVRRVIHRMPPEFAVLGREGVNAYVNAHGRHARLADLPWHRNERVYGDHHWLDIFVYDPSSPFLKGGEPRIVRPWLSAWQDRATGVVAWRIGERANAQLLSLAFRAYVLQWGLPEEAWMDNGQDYLSAQFSALCDNLRVEIHNTLPSSRTGESHAKSKPVERWFGTLERGIVSQLPGWCGSNPKEKPDDLHWELRKQHEAFLARERAETPLLTIRELDDVLRNWTEQCYLKRPQERLDASPLDAFSADAHPLQRITDERALDVLLWEARTRVIGNNGVEVEGQVYWSSEFYGLRGRPCVVRLDPAERSKVFVFLDHKDTPERRPGGEGRAGRTPPAGCQFRTFRAGHHSGASSRPRRRARGEGCRRPTRRDAARAAKLEASAGRASGASTDADFHHAMGARAVGKRA